MKMPVAGATDPNRHIPGILTELATRGIAHQLIPALSVEDTQLTDWIECRFPIVHSQVDWTKIARHECFEWNTLDDLLPTFLALTRSLNPGTQVVVMWANALSPSLKIRLGDLNLIAKAIFEEHETSTDVWVFSQREGWLIEMFHEGTVCFGRTQHSPD